MWLALHLLILTWPIWNLCSANYVYFTCLLTKNDPSSLTVSGFSSDALLEQSTSRTFPNQTIFDSTQNDSKNGSSLQNSDYTDKNYYQTCPPENQLLYYIELNQQPGILHNFFVSYIETEFLGNLKLETSPYHLFFKNKLTSKFNRFWPEEMLPENLTDVEVKTMRNFCDFDFKHVIVSIEERKPDSKTKLRTNSEDKNLTLIVHFPKVSSLKESLINTKYSNCVHLNQLFYRLDLPRIKTSKTENLPNYQIIWVRSGGIYLLNHNQLSILTLTPSTDATTQKTTYDLSLKSDKVFGVRDYVARSNTKFSFFEDEQICSNLIRRQCFTMTRF